jgi:hypothetical protein
VLTRGNVATLILAQIQTLVTMAAEEDVSAAFRYWADQPGFVADCAKAWRERQAADARAIIDRSGKDVKQFVDAIPQRAGHGVETGAGP